MVKLTVRISLRSAVRNHRRKKKIREREREKKRQIKAKLDELRRVAEERLRQTDENIIQAGRLSQEKRSFSLLIGPTNSAGQAHQWAQALTREGYPSQSLRISNDGANEWFQSDLQIPRLEWTALEGRIALARQIVTEFDAILLESMRPLFSLHTLRDYSASQALEDIHLLKKSKVRVAIVFHGSDIRDTQAHAKRERFSPYRTESSELEALRVRAAEFRNAGQEASKRGIPIFVTSPDLFLDMPRAHWLPIAIDVAHFVEAGEKRPCWSTPGPPRVLFQPSRGWLKSAVLVEPILEKLAEEGVIALIPNDQIGQHLMAERITSADVVIDRFDGIAGVTSMEALAAGRIVIANIAKWAYKHAQARPPILHATPETLEVTLRKIAKNREDSNWSSTKGLAYVHKWHDGTESARRIARLLRL